MFITFNYSKDINSHKHTFYNNFTILHFTSIARHHYLYIQKYQVFIEMNVLHIS